MNCHYCDLPPSNIQKTRLKGSRFGQNGEFIFSGLDRKDNDKGYSVENCVPCCAHCNRAKRALSYEEYLGWLRRIGEAYVRTDAFNLMIHSDNLVNHSNDMTCTVPVTVVLK